MLEQDFLQAANESKYQVENSLWRFNSPLTNVDEVRTMAIWLAKRSKMPVTVNFKQGHWYFSEESRYLAETVGMQLGTEKDFRELPDIAVEHWVMNTNFYSERMTEDPHWGRDASGKPYALPD